jgi:hypothetical protein
MLHELFLQHDQLRLLVDRCEQLADELDAGHGSAAALAARIAQLRKLLEHHNRCEEAQLRAVWVGSTGAEVVDQHRHEHRAMRERFATGPIAELRAALADLRAHLDAEERGLRAPDGVAACAGRE